MSKEYRVLGSVRAQDLSEKQKEDNQMLVEGYALKFGTESERMYTFSREDGVVEFTETIDRGALAEADMEDVRYLFNHDSSAILGRTTNGTLELEVDEVGLRYKAKLPNTTVARDVYENIRVGNISQCSFGFTISDGFDEVTKREDGTWGRVLRKIDSLFDVSAVTYPAYKDTDVSSAQRSIEKQISKDELEERQELLKRFEGLYLDNKLRELKGGSSK